MKLFNITSYYFAFITFVIVIKILFLLCILIRFILKREKKENTKLYKSIEVWKDRFEGIFILSMSALTIYIFNPRNKKEFVFDEYTKFLYFVFGIILVIEHVRDILQL
jgi:hypothetical protein